MVDVFDKKKRSEVMSKIRGKDTQPEKIIRKELFKMGFRYRLNCKTLPGKPDIVISKYKAIIFINGCFWHNHNCHLFKWPKTRQEFWKQKILGNKANDNKKIEALLAESWRVLIVWECSLKGKTKKTTEELIKEIVEWLYSEISFREIEGNNNGNG